MIPDPEEVVNAFLAEALELDRIGTSTPSVLAESWIRTTLIVGGKEPTSTPAHLVSCHFQFDCFAGEGRNTRAQASDLARDVWAALEDATGIHNGATINGASLIGLRPAPDTSIEPARERFILEARVWMHS